MKKYLKNYIEKNIKNILFILFFIIIGLVIGIVLFNLLDLELRDQVILSIKDTLNIARDNNFEGINIINNGIILNIIILAIIYFSSITFIPNVLINLITFLKGMSIGIYLSTIFSIFDFSNALVTSIIIILLPNIIYIPSYIYLCNNTLLLHCKIIEKNIKIYNLGIEVLKIIMGFSVIFLSVVLEQLGAITVINRYILL